MTCTRLTIAHRLSHVPIASFYDMRFDALPVKQNGRLLILRPAGLRRAAVAIRQVAAVAIGRLPLTMLMDSAKVRLAAKVNWAIKNKKPETEESSFHGF